MNILDVLNIAIEREKGAHDFYSRAAEITQDAKGKGMFVWLVQQELGHFNSLRNLKEALKKVSNEVEFGRLSDEDSKVIESMPKSEASGEVTDSTTALKALQIAMQAERDSIEIYRRVGRSTTDAGARAMFDGLVTEEQAHLLLLEAQHKAIEESQAFIPLNEFANLSDFQP